MKSGAPAYPFNSDAEVAAIRRADRDYYASYDELWDSQTEQARAFPTRPSDAALMPRESHLTLEELKEWEEKDAKGREARRKAGEANRRIRERRSA